MNQSNLYDLLIFTKEYNSSINEKMMCSNVKLHVRQTGGNAI